MIEREEHDGILTLRLAHGKASALDVELLEAMDRQLDEIRHVRAMVLTGTGSIFSAGVDLFRIVDGGERYVRHFLPLLSAVVRKLFAFPRPVVAAVNGHAIAGGCILTLAADSRLMASGKGRIGAPELHVGVPFPVAALEIARFGVRNDRLQQVVYSGQTFLAEEALTLGMVDEVVDPESLADTAEAMARKLASIQPEAFRLTKEQIRRPTFDRIDHLTPLVDPQVLEIWSAPETSAQIREYLAKTVKK